MLAGRVLKNANVTCPEEIESAFNKNVPPGSGPCIHQSAQLRIVDTPPFSIPSQAPMHVCKGPVELIYVDNNRTVAPFLLEVFPGIHRNGPFLKGWTDGSKGPRFNPGQDRTVLGSTAWTARLISWVQVHPGVQIG